MTLGGRSPFWCRLCSRDRALFLTILAFFFISGGCGLLYQVVWTRKLVLLFGITSYAVSTVLSIFFLGLGAGSMLGGRLADRTRRPLWWYGVFEIVIGLWALLFILLVGHSEALVVGALRTVAATRTGGVALRGLLSLAFLIVPVTLMGATLPLLAKFVTGQGRLRGLRIGALYSINTFGAVAGCACTGILLLARFGYTRTTLIGVAANVGVGILAILLSALTERASEQEAAPSEELAEKTVSQPEAAIPGYARAAVLAAFALSGFCMLALEVLWTRMLTVVFIGTTYAFTTMLTALLCGIAVGSTVISPFVDKRRSPVALLGLVEVLIGVTCLAMLPVFAGLPAKLAELQLSAGYSWDGVLRAKFMLSFAVLFVPTFFSGMTFPLVVKAITMGRPNLGSDVGKLYGANTFGGVVGALAGGYLILPHLGTQTGIITLAVVLFLAGVMLIAVCPGSSGRRKGVVAVFSIVVLVMAMRARPDDLDKALNSRYLPEDHVLLHHHEGVEGTVAVSEPEDNPGASDRYLWINGVQATASIEKGIKMNRFQGVLPLLFDRDPRLALFMCFGSGITCGTLGLYDFERIDAVELSPDVLEVAKFFATDNFNVRENPKVNFIVDDGRNFLLTTQNRYDLITFEPMPLAQAGVSTFYTQEYYRLCSAHLTPRGLVSQWVPLHSLDLDVVRSLIHTFTTVFPEYCAWFVNSDLFLIGSNEPLTIDYAHARDRTSGEAIAQGLRDVGITDLPELLTCFFLTKRGVDQFAEGGALMTDDRPWAEFVAPKLMYEHHEHECIKELKPLYESPLGMMGFEGVAADDEATARAAIDRRARARVHDLTGVQLVYSGMIGGEQEKHFKLALDVDPLDATARVYLKEILMQRVPLFIRWDQLDDAQSYLDGLRPYVPDLPELHLAQGDVYCARGLAAEAVKSYETYVAFGGNEQEAAERIDAVDEAPDPKG
jgi:spermidine synthase